MLDQFPFKLDQILGGVCARISMGSDLKKMRLTGRLRQGKVLILNEKYQNRDGVSGALGASIAARVWLTRWSKNIFNGLLRVPVKIKIPALNLI
jgi:hypothetical protein